MGVSGQEVNVEQFKHLHTPLKNKNESINLTLAMIGTVPWPLTLQQAVQLSEHTLLFIFLDVIADDVIPFKWIV